MVTAFNQLSKKSHQSHHTPKIRLIFLRKLTILALFQTNHTLFLKTLCTIIPNAGGIKSVKMSLEKYSKRTTSTKVFITLLALIVTLNNFIFNCKNYLQIKGWTMRKSVHSHTQTSL